MLGEKSVYVGEVGKVCVRGGGDDTATLQNLRVRVWLLCVVGRVKHNIRQRSHMPQKIAFPRMVRREKERCYKPRARLFFRMSPQI